MIEVWCDIEGYEGFYKVSNLGRIMSLSRELTCIVFGKTQKTYKTKERILKGVPDKDGYLLVSLAKNGISKHFKIHRLVATAFLKKVKGKDFINHKNGIKSDNRSENLEYCTLKENAVHAKKILHTRNRSGRNISQYSLDGKYIRDFKTITEAANYLGTTKNNIFGCLKGKSRSSCGFIFRYSDGSKNNIEPYKPKDYKKQSKASKIANEIYHSNKNLSYQEALKLAWSKVLRKEHI